jgi:hypothetical protein
MKEQPKNLSGKEAKDKVPAPPEKNGIFGGGEKRFTSQHEIAKTLNSSMPKADAKTLTEALHKEVSGWHGASEKDAQKIAEQLHKEGKLSAEGYRKFKKAA